MDATALTIDDARALSAARWGAAALDPKASGSFAVGKLLACCGRVLVTFGDSWEDAFESWQYGEHVSMTKEAWDAI